MKSDLIPPDIAQFIVEKIDSVMEVEALVLLRNYSKKEWDVAAVANRLYVGEKDARVTLDRLVEEKLLVTVGKAPARYRYSPASPELKALIDRLTELYSKHLVPVTNLIHSKPRTRIQEFADAFKFRKDD